jgi:hypothetical protein
MHDVIGKIGRWGWSLALALALGCSSQQAPDSASGGSSGSATGGADGTGGAEGDAGDVCGIIAYQVPIQTGSAACTIRVALPTSAPGPDNVRVQDQSMTTIPYASTGTDNGWSYGDPLAPIILVGSYCADAMAGKLTAVTILVSCVGHPIP